METTAVNAPERLRYKRNMAAMRHYARCWHANKFAEIKRVHKPITADACARYNETRRNNRCNSTKRSACIHNIKREITDDEIIELVMMPCYYCGQDPAGGCDRKDSNMHYCVSNCVPACSTCNMMKGGHLPEVFVELCANVARHADDPTFVADKLHPAPNHSYIRWKNGRISDGYDVRMTDSERTAITNISCVFCGAPGPSTLDRIDNNICYLESNCQPACITCNYMKRQMSNNEFISHCREVFTHLQPIQSTSFNKCRKCSNDSTLINTDLCKQCYWLIHFDKNRDLSARETYAPERKKCPNCGIDKYLKYWKQDTDDKCADCLLLVSYNKSRLAAGKNAWNMVQLEMDTIVACDEIFDDECDPVDYLSDPGDSDNDE